MGSVDCDDANDVPHVIALPVPSSLNLIMSFWKLAGVPVRLVVIDVIATASAVIVTASHESVFMDGVAELVIVVTLGTGTALSVVPLMLRFVPSVISE